MKATVSDFSLFFLTAFLGRKLDLVFSLLVIFSFFFSVLHKGEHQLQHRQTELEYPLDKLALAPGRDFSVLEKEMVAASMNMLEVTGVRKKTIRRLKKRKTMQIDKM